jgi:hypothetical protein
MDTLIRIGEHSGNTPDLPRTQLNLVGWLSTALVFGIGLLLCVWVGWFAGAIYGLEKAEPILTAPAGGGAGLAPDITPAVAGVVEIGIGALLGIGCGLAGGIVVMLLFCRLFVIPLMRRIPHFTQSEI